MTDTVANDGRWDRRAALRALAVMAGATAAAPLLGEPATAQADPGGDADALFKAGKFEQAARAYEEILAQDPGNLHAARRRGHIGLLANRFPEAEKYLGMALELAPDDKETNKLLGDCYTRQDKFSLAVPRWLAAGDEIRATWLAAVRGEPFQVHGDTTRLPWLKTDPYPLVAASVNGGPVKHFTFYTGAPLLGVSAPVAEEAGLSAVAKQKIDFMDGSVWMYFAVLESFRLGDIELRNLPVGWSEPADGPVVPEAHDGIIGTWVFTHLLPTFDYAGRSLILRRRTPEAAREARADAERAGARPLPLWQAREHMLHSVGSIAGSGQRVMGVNFGGTGEIAAGTSVATAERLGIRTDYDRPIQTFAHSHPALVYPCYPNEVRIGGASARAAYCYANENRDPTPFGFDVLGHFSHSFWKPYNITVDFTDMKLHIARGAAS